MSELPKWIVAEFHDLLDLGELCAPSGLVEVVYWENIPELVARVRGDTLDAVCTECRTRRPRVRCDRECPVVRVKG